MMGLFTRQPDAGDAASPLTAAPVLPAPLMPETLRSPADAQLTGDTERLAADNVKLRDELHERLLNDALAEANVMVRLVDPRDALRYLDPASLVGQDGRPDIDRVTAEMSQLAAERPYLRQNVRPAPGSANGGPIGQLGYEGLRESDLDHMTAEQIDAAHRRGHLNHILGIQ